MKNKNTIGKSRNARNAAPAKRAARGLKPWSWRWMAEKCGQDVAYFHKACTGQVGAASGQIDTWAAMLGLPSGDALRKFAQAKLKKGV